MLATVTKPVNSLLVSSGAVAKSPAMFSAWLSAPSNAGIALSAMATTGAVFPRGFGPLRVGLEPAFYVDPRGPTEYLLHTRDGTVYERLERNSLSCPEDHPGHVHAPSELQLPSSMKILSDRTVLLEGFNVVSSVIPSKTTKPILQNVLLRTDGDSITLFATDLEMAARVQVDSVKISKQGAVLLPGREIGALLREISDPTVTLESTDQRCKIESSGGSFVLLGEDVDQYPEEARFESRMRLEIPRGSMLRMIQETVFAAAREETRYAINGVMADCGDGCIRLVATDGRRLSISYQNVETKSGSGDDDVAFKAVIPLRALSTLAKALSDGDKAPLLVEIGDKQISFTAGRVQLISQLLETRFPDYEGVVPKSADTTVEIDLSTLEGALRRASILAASEMRMVRFEVGDDQLRMTAESTSRGRADVTIDAVVKGAGGSINFNPDYILEALRVCELERVRLDMSDDSMPAKFTLGESFTYVVMPISGA
ncbi:MAG: DNA polymerase III subunit beta [Planctomycetes bacterium]|nr:DNA polymerase III subunit beta [Planctomycetota bacterium]